MEQINTAQSSCTSSQTNPHSPAKSLNLDIFSKKYKGTQEQQEGLEVLKNWPEMKLVRLPLFEDACDEYIELKTGALEKKFINGTDEEQSELFWYLLESCLNDALPQSQMAIPKQFLLRFVEALKPTRCWAPCFTENSDPDQMLVLFLRGRLTISLEEIAKHPDYDDPDYLEDPQSHLESLCEDIKLIYKYLQKYDDDDVDQLFLTNVRIHISDDDNLNVALNICDILTDVGSSHPDLLALKKVLSNIPVDATSFDMDDSGLSAYLIDADGTYNCDLVAYWHGIAESDPLKQINYYSQAAMLGFEPAIDKLNDMAESYMKFGDIAQLPDIFEPDVDISREQWKQQVKATTEQLVLFEKVSRVFEEQHFLFHIDSDATFEARIKIGSSYLEDNQHNAKLWGVRILHDLAELTDHPCASKAGLILDNWLSEGTNCIWLIKHYMTQSSFVNEGTVLENYKEKLTIETNKFAQLLRVLKSDQVQHAVYQLIDKITDVEFSNYGDDEKKLPGCSVVCEILLPEVIDDPVMVEEIKIHKAICDGEMRRDDERVLNCFKAAANVHGRPILTYTIGTLLCSDPEYAQSESIGQALPYFESANAQGVVLAQSWLNKRTKWLDKSRQRISDSMNNINSPENKNNSKHDDSFIVLSEYRKMGNAGDQEARFKFLKLLIGKKVDPGNLYTDALLEQEGKTLLDLELELAKIYLTRSSAPNPQKNVEKAKKLLAAAANEGHVEAAVLLALHHSTVLMNPPKFISTGLLSKTAIDYLRLAFENSFKKDIKNIYENGLPVILMDAVKAMGSDALNLVWNMSEEYDSVITIWKRDPVLAGILLKTAAELGQSEAVNKLAMAEQELAKELKTKVDLMMKEEKQAQEKRDQEEKVLLKKERQKHLTELTQNVSSDEEDEKDVL